MGAKKGLEGRKGGQGGWGGVCTLTRFLKPSMRMSSAVKMRLAALRTSQADDAMATTATCSPAKEKKKRKITLLGVITGASRPRGSLRLLP